jgi:hypothetical protein
MPPHGFASANACFLVFALLPFAGPAKMTVAVGISRTRANENNPSLLARNLDDVTLEVFQFFKGQVKDIKIFALESSQNHCTRRADLDKEASARYKYSMDFHG